MRTKLSSLSTTSRRPPSIVTMHTGIDGASAGSSGRMKAKGLMLSSFRLTPMMTPFLCSRNSITPSSVPTL